MSIIAKFPWHRGEYYTVLQRDHLFEALKSPPPPLLSLPLFCSVFLKGSRNRDTPHLNA